MKKMKLLTGIFSTVFVTTLTAVVVLSILPSLNKEPNQIRIVTPDSVITLSAKDIKDLENQFGSKSNLFDDELPPVETDSVKQLTAKWIQSAFFNSSFTGYYDYDYLTTTPLPTKDSTVYKPLLTDDWEAPALTDVSDIFKNYIEVKLYLDTTGSNKRIDYYLAELSATNTNITTACGYFFSVPGANFETIFDMQAPAHATQYATCLATLSEDVDYRLSIYNFMYSYSYLWQFASGNVDYFLTKYMEQQRLGFVWSMDVNSVGTDIPWNSFASLANQPISDTSSGSTPGTSEWFDLMDTSNLPYLPGNSVQKNTFSGENESWDVAYNGLLSESSANIGLDPNDEDNDVFGINSAFTFNPGVGGLEDSTEIGFYGFDTLANPNIYRSYVGGTSDPQVIFEKPSSGGGEGESALRNSVTGTISAVTLIYPWVFAKEYNPANGGTAEDWWFSMYAKEKTLGSGQYVSASKDEAGAVSIFDVLTANLPGTLNPVYTQLYVINTVYNSAKETIEKDTQKFFGDRGFYIELSGSFEDDYGPLIPKGLQKQD